MTQNLQPGQHPDADQLNAFVEHHLPLHERQETLAHLATCADCRATVYLARPVGVDESVQPVATRKPWFSGWNLAWPAAAAIACLVILTVHLHNVTAGKHEAAAIATADLEQTSGSLAATVPPAAVAPSMPSFAIVDGGPKRKSPSPAPAAASMAGPLSAGSSPRAGMSASDSALPQLNAASAAAQRNSSAPAALQSLSQQYHAPAPAAPPPPAVSTSDALASTNQTVAVMDAMSVEPEGNRPSSIIAGAAIGSLELSESAKLQRQPVLPSHLPVLSIISHVRHELAIDTVGTLFRSDDAGATWHLVPAQWTGLAVRVSLAQSTNKQMADRNASQESAIQAEAKRAVAVPAQSAAFELTTDTGELWSSSDGQTWKRK